VSEDVVVVGAGVAGLACAVALSERGVKPLVLERKPYVGGRAYSYAHPALGEVIDSQHVLLGCCTNLLDLCRMSGADAHLRWYDEIPFLEPGGRTSLLRAGMGARAGMGFLRAPMLGFADKVGIARGLREFLGGYPGDDRESFAAWLKRTKQTERAVRHFWEPVVVATLNDGFERCSVKYAGQVFHEAFVKSHEGGRMAIPTEPLSEFYARVARLAEAQGAELRLRASVDAMVRADGGWELRLSGGETVRARTVVLALPFEQTGKLVETLPEDDAARMQFAPVWERFTHAPITTIHLWFDRAVTDVEQCALLDTRVQWMFNKSAIRRETGRGQYLELVISASFAELKMGREEILASALRELEMFFPQVREAKVVKAGVLKEARATFSVVPGLDAVRPSASVGEGLYVAGDWCATGWPSTMEGGVRSGRIAAGAVVGESCLAAELPVSGLARMFAR
jgi:zeta-carotene desaturase